MKIILLPFALLFCAAPMAAQTEWIQNTRVRIQNSNKAPVPNAHVVFEGAPAKFSGQDGKVRLAFANKKPGAYTFLVELTKEGFELVNNKDFENIKLSADAQLGVDIILAKTGVVDAAKKEYYDISDRSLKAGFEREKAKIRHERDEAKITAQHFEEQWKQLQEQYDNQKKELDVLAEKFARINFDDVDSLYRQALELFKDGKIDAAIEMLENADPFKLIEQIIEQEAQDADDQKELDARKQATAKTKQKIIAQVRLLADIYGVKFNQAKAEALFDGLIRLDSTNLEILRDAADFYHDNHRYDKALRILPLIIAHPQSEDWQKALSHEYSGEIYTSIGQLPDALTAFTKYQNFHQLQHKQHPASTFYKESLAVSYSKLGSTHSALGNLNKALGFYKERSRLGKELYEAYPQNVSFKNGLAISYEKLGDTHSALGNLNKALGFYEERSRLGKELYEAYPQNVSFKNGLAISYSKLGDTHSALGNLNKALGFYEDETKLFEELYEAHPQNVSFKNGLAISYSKLGDTHSALGNLNKALGFYEDETKLFEELYEAYPQNVSFKNGLAISYAKLGGVYASKGDFIKAKIYYNNYQILEKELFEKDPVNINFMNGIAISNAKLGMTFLGLGELVKSKEHFLESKLKFTKLAQAAPSNIHFQANYAQSKAVLAAINSIGKLEIDKKEMKEARQIFEDVIKKTTQPDYQKREKIIEKMMLAGADLKSLIIEISSFTL